MKSFAVQRSVRRHRSVEESRRQIRPGVGASVASDSTSEQVRQCRQGLIGWCISAPLYCPICEKPTELVGQQKQWQTDFPVQQATTAEFQIDVARCTKCGQLRARHADQTSDAVGSAAVQIGPRAVAFAAKLSKKCGGSYARIAALFEKGFGLVTSPSTMNRAVGPPRRW